MEAIRVPDRVVVWRSLVRGETILSISMHSRLSHFFGSDVVAVKQEGLWLSVLDRKIRAISSHGCFGCFLI